MNQSEVEVMFASGAGLRIEESRGLLNIVVALPHSFNESDWVGSDCESAGSEVKLVI